MLGLQLDVLLVRLVDRALKIESVISIDDFEEALIVRQVGVVLCLFLEGDF